MFAVDTSKSRFLVVGEAEEYRKYNENKPREMWEQRFDENGELLYQVQLVAMGEGRAQLIKVSVAGDPGVKEGELVRVEGLMVSVWERDKKSGVSFRARAVLSVASSSRVEKAAA